MDTQEVIAESPAADAAVANKKIECLIHVRFNPNGTVMEIGERPQGVEQQMWFNYLSEHTLNCYQALSGGRGMFRLPRPEVDALKAACSAGLTA